MNYKCKEAFLHLLHLPREKNANVKVVQIKVKACVSEQTFNRKYTSVKCEHPSCKKEDKDINKKYACTGTHSHVVNDNWDVKWLIVISLSYIKNHIKIIMFRICLTLYEA